MLSSTRWRNLAVSCCKLLKRSFRSMVQSFEWTSELYCWLPFSSCAGAPICCGSCCSSDPQQRYNSVQKAIKILLTFRVFLVNIAAIGIYAGTLGGLIVYFVTTLISAGMVLYTIASLAIMCKFYALKPSVDNWITQLLRILMHPL